MHAKPYHALFFYVCIGLEEWFVKKIMRFNTPLTVSYGITAKC